LARITHIEFPVLSKYTVMVNVSKDIKKSILEFPGSDGECKDGVEAMTFAQDEPLSIIFLTPSVSVGTIAHEAWHAVEAMMKFTGAEIESEMVAYHLGYLVDKIFKFVRKGKA
jgi:hypothetical protein